MPANSRWDLIRRLRVNWRCWRNSRQISEAIFQKTNQDPKSRCYHLVLKYYFTSEQLKVFKENPCSLNMNLLAERSKEIYDLAKCPLSTKQRFFQASNWMICWLYTSMYVFTFVLSATGDALLYSFCESGESQTLLFSLSLSLSLYIYIYIYSAYWSNCQRTGNLRNVLQILLRCQYLFNS